MTLAFPSLETAELAHVAALKNRAVTAYIGLGANLGDAPQALARAAGTLGRLPYTRLAALSHLYQSGAVEVDEEQPDYTNAVAAIETRLDAETLLSALFAIEKRFGRKRAGYHAPRTLDLDLLLYSDECHHLPHLTVPHPRLHYRAFVLVPLLEIAPDLTVPGLGPLARYLPLVADQPIRRLAPLRPITDPLAQPASALAQ